MTGFCPSRKYRSEHNRPSVDATPLHPEHWMSSPSCWARITNPEPNDLHSHPNLDRDPFESPAPRPQQLRANAKVMGGVLALPGTEPLTATPARINGDGNLRPAPRALAGQPVLRASPLRPRLEPRPLSRTPYPTTRAATLVTHTRRPKCPTTPGTILHVAAPGRCNTRPASNGTASSSRDKLAQHSAHELAIKHFNPEVLHSPTNPGD